MRIFHLLIFGMILSHFPVAAQHAEELKNKQQVFSDSNIVWAAYFEMDLVPDLPIEYIRKKHARLPNLAEGYGQLSDTLKFLPSTIDTPNHQMLNGFILGQTESIQFYESDATDYGKRSHKLKSRLHHWNLALENINLEPETFGTYEMLPNDYFEVFRLKGILYYQKDTRNFYAIPEAVAMLKNLDGDSQAVWDYEIVAWMPVNELAQGSQQSAWDLGPTVWAQYMERSIPLTDLFVFKQDWTSDEVFFHQTNFLRKNASHLKVLHPYPPHLEEYVDERSNGSGEDINFFPNNFTYMTTDEVEAIATYNEMAIKEDEYGGFEEVNYPITWSAFKGIRFGMNWAWSNKTKELSVEMATYLPFDNTTEDGMDFFVPTYYYRLPFGNINIKK
ncbi:MAG: hypothetical protein AAFU57_18080 [Bacteroidota bacterium]